MKFMICGGGSGGHVSPAIAIYEALKKKAESPSFTFVGRSGGSENRAYELTGERLRTLSMSGINGKNPKEAAKGLISAIKARTLAKKIISEEHPDVIIGTGGYICWPMLSQGVTMGIPTVIHESNAYPGLTTRLVSKKSDKVLLNYESATGAINRRDNVRIVGNPIREQFFTTDRASARKMLGVRDGDVFILSFGGSLGSQRLNEVTLELMRAYSSKQRHIKHLHATGSAYFDEIGKGTQKALGDRCGCIILPYIDDMASAMAGADIVISRCGAMTVSEICAVGVASILIPSPNVADDHQTKNGAFMQSSGAAVMIEEKDLSLRVLLDTVRSLECSHDRRENMSANARALARSDASELIAEEIIGLIRK